MDNLTPPKIESTLMKDQKPTKEKAAGGFAGFLSKLGLGGTAATGSAGGGIAIGGAQAVGSAGFLSALSSNAGIVAATLIATGIGVSAALLNFGHAPKAMQKSQFFAKLGVDSASHSERIVRDAREKAMQTSGMDSDGVSSSLQHLVDANTGSMGQLEGDGAAADGESVDSSDSASAEVPENTVQAPNNDWNDAAAKAVAGAGVDGRKKLKKAAFKKRSSGASTKLAMGGPAATGRKIAGSSGKLSNFSAGKSASTRGRSTARTRKSVSRGSGAKSASGQARLTNKRAQSSLASGPGSQKSYMDGSGSRIGKAGGGASKIAGSGGGGASSGNGNPIVNPVTSQNTSSSNPPPPIKKKKDKTPYRKEMKMAAGLLILATGLLIIASLIAKKRDPKTLPMAKIVAGIAFVAAVAAAALGVIIMVDHKQQMQGGMIAAAGGMMALAAGKVVLTPEKSDEEIAKEKAATELSKSQAQAKLDLQASQTRLNNAEAVRLEQLNAKPPAPTLDAGTTPKTNPGADHIDTSNWA